MPNTPEFIDLALQTLEKREKEQAGYQKLNGYIDEITKLVDGNTTFRKAHFHGFELTGNVPHQETLQARIRLLTVDLDYLNKTPARVMVSMDLYPAGRIVRNEDKPLGSIDYTLGDNLLIRREKNKFGNKMYGITITPGADTFDRDLLNIRLVINTANEVLQGLSL